MSPEVVEGISVTVDGAASGPMKIFLMLTALSFLSAAVISVTSFTRIVIVLSFLRQALGTPQLPPNPVLIGLSLFLTFFVMHEPLGEVWSQALVPLLDDQLSFQQAIARAERPLATFMLQHTREQDLLLFFDIAQSPLTSDATQIPITVLIPAFMVSELTAAFTIGLYIYIPLLLIDLLVSGILMALGMLMVPPSMISLPVKLGVFVLADGWALVVGNLARSFLVAT